MSILLKAAARSSRQLIARSNTRAIFGVDDKIKNPDPIEHTTGKEKLMLLLEERGITDPFHYATQFKRGPGTKENPNIVPTFEDRRMIGCQCDEDATSINYMWVHLDEPKRCECGHWFKAVEAPDYEEMLGLKEKH